MRLVFNLGFCGGLLILAGCQPENGKNNKESKVDEVSTAQVTISTKNKVPPSSQNTLKNVGGKISADKWKRANASQRAEIATRLISEKHLIGLSENDVIVALGNPSQRFERILYNFYVDLPSMPDTIPGLMILIGRAGTVERVGSTSFPLDKDTTIVPFEKQKWMESDDYTRFSMAPSIWRGKLLDGKNRSQVFELLGEPSKTIPPLLMYKCGMPASSASGNDQPREKTLSIWFDKDRVVRNKLQ